MKSNRLFTFSLPGLAALYVLMPYTKPAFSPRVQPAATAASVPCIDAGKAQFLVSVSVIERLKSANCSYLYSTEMDSIAGSCWMSEDDMIFWNANQLQVFSRKTQQAVPIAGTSVDSTGKYLACGASLSPDGRWLVWAGAEDGHATWDAVTTDGTEHRQWPRVESTSIYAVSWMQDSTHWVEICCPKTKLNASLWREHPENMQARVYSTATPRAESYPLYLETPEPEFTPPANHGGMGEFIFTQDGRAWLSRNWQGSPTQQLGGPCSREDVYELVPGHDAWTLHRSYIYPSADRSRYVFDSPKRSPDGNWIAWRNYAPDGRDKLRLMLSRTDGSGMQEIYQSDTNQGVEPQWSPDSRQIAFDTATMGIITLKIDPVIAQSPSCSPGKAVARVLPPGKFPVAPVSRLLANKPPFSAELYAQR